MVGPGTSAAAATSAADDAFRRHLVVRAPRRGVQAALFVAALAAAAVSVWLTLRASFLAQPRWLAAQKADLILGPVLTGLYWWRARPASRMGWMLVAYGLVNAGYIAQSSGNSRLFGLGLVWESFIYLGSQIIILAFPTGRLDGLAAKVVLLGSVANAAFNVWLIAMLPETGAGGPISGCLSTCPRNALAVTPNVGRALDLIKPFQIGVIAVAAATGLLLIWRIATGTPPQRRALAIGTAIALVFLALQIAYLALSLLDVHAADLQTALQWSYTGARALVWYGFALALVAAQLFAGRATRRLMRQSLRRPSQRELEAMLREPLGDPSLELRFWDSQTDDWDAPIEPSRGSAVTFVDREGTWSVALIHDRQLTDDPELLETAGSIALLAAENAQLEVRWKGALHDLEESRNRIARAIDNERQRLAVDLHDGTQQRLGAVRLRLEVASVITAKEEVRERLQRSIQIVDETIEELREITHQIYPHLLTQRGLIDALERAVDPLRVRHNEFDRQTPGIEAAVYYCVLEAVRNATKHGGQDVAIDIFVEQRPDAIVFGVTDDGPGFDPSAPSEGLGLQSFRDRLEAFSGTISITSVPGQTMVEGSIPLPATRSTT